MSTRCLVGKMTGEGTFFARYTHHDGYIEGVGKALYELYNDRFDHDLSAMLKVLLDDHPAGWSAIAFCDFTLKPGYVETFRGYPSMSDFPDTDEGWQRYRAAKEKYKKSVIWRRPKCYCHGDRHEEVDDRIQDEESQADTEYAYVLDDTSDGPVMYCCKPLEDFERWLVPVTIFRTFGVWGAFASIALGGPEPDWKRISDIIQYREEEL